VADPIVPTPFTYTRPETLEAALRAMAEDGAHALAGGSDLVSLRAAGTIAPRLPWRNSRPWATPGSGR
jgi:CO/xanthine dehydrogenase FAD-binding subunit